jgi:hypothetical protein
MRTAEIAAAHGLSVLTDCDGSTCRSNCNQLIVATHARPARTGPLELSAEPMECSAATADSLIEHSARANVQLCQRALKRCHRACPHHRESSSGASQFAVFTFFCARVLDRSCSTCASGQRARVIKLFVFMSAHASFMYNVRALNLCQERPWSKLCALTSYRSQARTVHDHTTCAQVVQALRASSRPPRVLDLRGRSASNALLLRSTSARAQPVLGLDGTSAAPTSSARVSWPRQADTIDTSSTAAQGHGLHGDRNPHVWWHLHPFCAHFGAVRTLRSQKISLDRAAQLSFLKSCLLRIFEDANWSANLHQ